MYLHNQRGGLALDSGWCWWHLVSPPGRLHVLVIIKSAIDYNGRYAMPKKKKKKKKKKKADLTTVLHIRELPHLHMKLAVWFSFPTTNNKNPMIPSWSLVSIYNYSFNPDQIFTKNFEKLELEICSKIFYMWHDILQVNSSLPTSLKKYMLSH